MAVQRNPVFVSPEEFLEIRRTSDKRLEYISGEIYEWSTGTGEHGRIIANITGELTIGLRGKPCGPGVDISVVAPASYLVPDVVVYCGRGDFTEDNILRNPVVIVEVLSPSTRDFDKSEKWMRYQFLPSLMHYALVSQDEPQVELFTRERDDWRYHAYIGLDAVVDLVHIDCRLPLSSIYERVDFEPTNP